MIKEIKGLPAAWLDTTVYWIISICRQCISFENNIVFEKRFYHFNAFNENSIWYESLKTSSEIEILLMLSFYFSPLLHPPPTHTHTPPSPSNTLLLCFSANYLSKEQFISMFIISSIPPKITSVNSLSLREREMRGSRKIFILHLSLSFSHFRCILHFVKAYGNGRGADGDLVPRAVQMTYE